MKPPMIPHQGRAIDTLNFRNVKESLNSIDMGNGIGAGGGGGGKSKNEGAAAAAHGQGLAMGAGVGVAGDGAAAKGVSKDGLLGVPASGLKGVPLDSGENTPGGELADPFEEFNSVTLHHDGEEHGEGRRR